MGYKEAFEVFNQKYEDFLDNKEVKIKDREEYLKNANSLINGVFSNEFQDILDKEGVSSSYDKILLFLNENLDIYTNLDIANGRIGTIDIDNNEKVSKLLSTNELISEVFDIKKEDKYHNLISLYFSEKKKYEKLMIYYHIKK
tara:strand:+ start:7899 stop:8327 length:429 start_codon:yes stop_codon:yes gene_type:complete